MQACEKETPLKQIAEHVHPPPEPEDEAVSLMMAEEPGIPEESSPTQIIEDVLCELESEGSNLAVASPEAGKEPGTSDVTTGEVPSDRGLKAGVHEVIKVDEEGADRSLAFVKSLLQLK